ncbi:MAG: T9SS type A sorting domain-containing protein [bacterium]
MSDLCINIDNSRILFSYNLNQETPVEIKIFNILGQLIFINNNGCQKPGFYQMEIDKPRSPGVYFLNVSFIDREYSYKFNLIY